MLSEAFRRDRCRGFSLIELMATLVIVAILGSIALPSYQGYVVRGRRSEAISQLMAMQQAEEAWRGNHVGYATQQDLGPLFAAQAGARYAFEVRGAGPDSYELFAAAIGPQSQDSGCAVLKLAVVGGQMVRASGNDFAASNPEAANQRCWNL